MSNKGLRDKKKYEEIKKCYNEDLLTLEESCKKNNVTLKTYYNICKRIGEKSIACQIKINNKGGGFMPNINDTNINDGNVKIVKNNNIKAIIDDFNRDDKGDIDRIIEHHTSVLSTDGKRKEVGISARGVRNTRK